MSRDMMGRERGELGAVPMVTWKSLLIYVAVGSIVLLATWAGGSWNSL